MKFSLKWLGDFIDVRQFMENPKQLAEVLTQAGLEVDSFENQRACFKNIVVAQIDSVEKHPQADRLTLCKVSTESENYSIVCGAKNHKAGNKAVLAKPGAVLPGDFLIKKTRIRGVESEGMLVSRKELGLEPEGEGIWILPKETKVGQSLSDYLGFEDVIFDVSVQPNRSDCLSHKGLAREISCLFSLPFSIKDASFPEKSSLSVKQSLKVEVRDKQACPRYCGRLIEGVQIGESPPWLKNRLKSLELKSINNVVDITNLVLWDRGQPLHAFDRDQIQTLTVAPSQKGEKFLTLDESELVLTGEELTIRDKDRVLALAGVIGGMDSGITEKTRNIFIESAGFAPESIRRTSRRFGLETDSSYRFARGIDLTAVKEAMDFACFLIQKTAGGKISGDFYDLCSQKTHPICIRIGLQDLEDRLGYPAASFDFENWMKKLGCQVKGKGDNFELWPPPYRPDLKIKEDLMEEFARLEGYDKIPENLTPPAGLPKASDSQFVNSQKLIHFLSGRGLHQAVNYSFSDLKYYKEFLEERFFLESLSEREKPMEELERKITKNKELHKDKREVENLRTDENKIKNNLEEKKVFFVKNPISQQLSLMKPLLIPDLVKNVLSNFRHNNKFGQIFELSPVFYQEGKDYQQSTHLALAFWGRPVTVWKSRETPNVYSIKSVLESLFEAFRIKGCSWTDGEISFLHPGQSRILSFKNKAVGFLGSLHPHLLQQYKIPLDVALAEIHWRHLDQETRKPLKYKAFPSLPVVEKDLCFVVPLSLSVEDVRREIKKGLGSLCEKIEIFDIYEKQKERSVSFRMYLMPEEKSWTDEQLQGFLNQVVQTVHKKFSIGLKPDF